MLTIVEFLGEESKYRLFGIQNVNFKYPHFYSRDMLTWANNKEVREYCMYRASTALKILEKFNKDKNKDNPISYSTASLELLEEVAKQESWKRKLPFMAS